MINEQEIRSIANRCNNHIKATTTSDERRMIIENAIREAVMSDRAEPELPNAGCL